MLLGLFLEPEPQSYCCFKWWMLREPCAQRLLPTKRWCSMLGICRILLRLPLLGLLPVSLGYPELEAPNTNFSNLSSWEMTKPSQAHCAAWTREKSKQLSLERSENRTKKHPDTSMVFSPLLSSEGANTGCGSQVTAILPAELIHRQQDRVTGDVLTVMVTLGADGQRGGQSVFWRVLS